MNQSRPRVVQRLAWLALCGAAFFLEYGFANWLTSQRGDVGTFYWAWEKHIPFIPELIVPYWSLDLLFALAFFLPGTRHELNLLGRRVFTLITLTCACFLIWPLQFGLVRPIGTGWTEPWFRLLQANDLPFNMAPSLHIGLRCLFWITYGRHLRGWLRTGLRYWFIAIGCSTLFVWQHHFIDVGGGFLMAYGIVALFPDRETQPGPGGFLGERSPASRRLALRYALGAIACAIAALPGGAWLWLAWPAMGLAIYALAYATGNPRWLQKSSGAITPAAEWILLPVILIARLWQWRWLHTQPAWRGISPGVYSGRRLTNREAREFLRQHPHATIIDLTAETNESTPFRESARYLSLPILDLTPPSAETCRQACELIAQQLHQGPVYLHCLLGLGRSARVAAAWRLHGSSRIAPHEESAKTAEPSPPSELCASLPSFSFSSPSE